MAILNEPEHHEEAFGEILGAAAQQQPMQEAQAKAEDKMTEDEKKALQIHNQARRDASKSSGHGRPDLVWDNKLEKDAIAYAQHLCRANKGLQHSSGDQRPNQGENLYWSKPNGSLEAASKGWMDEKKNYHGQKIGEGDFGSYGHYTQSLKGHIKKSTIQPKPIQQLAIEPASMMALDGPSVSNNLPSADLLGLPDELLLQIVALLWHSDLENSSACCKRAHRVSDGQMAIHLDYKRRYSTVVVPEYDHSSLTSEKHRKPAIILNNSLNKGVLGECIQKLVFDGNLSFLARKSHQKDFIDLKRTLRSPDIRASWNRQGPTYDQWVNGLLIEVSPRLKCLEITCGAISDISRYIESRIRSSALDLPKALKGLKKVLVKGGGRNVMLAEIYPFIGLPIIHTLRVHDLIDRKPSLHPNDYRFQSGISSLTTPELFDSVTTAEGIAQLLQPSKHNSLESFTYEVNHEVQHPQQFDWDPRSVLRILRHYALESLTHLTIIGSRRVQKMGQISCGGFVGSLVQFNRLQYVHLECYMLIFKRRIVGKAIGSGDSGIAESVLSDPPTQSIVDLFPPSLQTLKLVRRDQTDIQVERMLGGMWVGCKALPCLKEVAIHTAVDPDIPIG
ncbi:MAG: hypothetical protein Q9178_007455 [Gyalolechia marmorata]